MTSQLTQLEQLKQELSEKIPYTKESQALDLIKISGKDAFDFLQSQLTQDLRLLETSQVEQLSPTFGIWSAYCSPKGKVLATFYVFKMIEETPVFYLLIDGSLTESMTKRLKMFVLRRSVNFEVIAINTARDLLLFSNYLPSLFVEHLNKIRVTLNSQDEIRKTWYETCLMNGLSDVTNKKKTVAWIHQKTSDSFTPHMLELDKIAVSFQKGCYPGQEVVARSQYLGSVKRCLHFIDTNTNNTNNSNNANMPLSEKNTNLYEKYQQALAENDVTVLYETNGVFVLCGAK